ncbi:FecCD family ABC transporter permease [Phaeobacter sp. QD34_3]|uniref:FecCD family ABC transporter permease n=1 Tax=unclassified Phaeobacter TaxID=2621772 RepID=UPI00406C16A9
MTRATPGAVAAVQPATDLPPLSRPHPRSHPRSLWFAGSILLVIALAVMSLRFGIRATHWSEIWMALTAYDGDIAEHIVVQTMRLPRLCAALLTGAALGTAGALIQALSRNPLADPGLLGVNGGAALGVVLCILVLNTSDPADFIWAALAGGFIAAGLVYFVGGGSRASVLRLILAGAAVSALFMALTRGLLLASQQALDVYRFWVLGGFDGIQAEMIYPLLPFLGLGAVLAAAATYGLNALSLGEEIARGLGVRTGLARLTAGLAIVVLCGASVALAGPIAFVGLIVPHLARWIAGPGLGWTVLFSSSLGACLLLAADLLGRLPLFGGNMQAGVMTALIGGPMLIWLVRRHGVGTL